MISYKLNQTWVGELLSFGVLYPEGHLFYAPPPLAHGGEIELEWIQRDFLWGGRFSLSLSFV